MKLPKQKMRLDDLLDQTEPHATFHDATLDTIKIDYEAHELTAEFKLCVGNPNGKTKMERERHRSGMLKVSGLIFWALEPPDNKDTKEWGPLWLTGDGLIEEAPTETAKKLTSISKPETYGWYLYFSDINAFAYLASREAVFEWKTAQGHPADRR
jgi:hypothetical protein